MDYNAQIEQLKLMLKYAVRYLEHPDVLEKTDKMCINTRVLIKNIHLAINGQ